MADEREIHAKLNQILNLLDEIEQEKEIEPSSEEKFSQRLCEDVFNGEENETDLDMYLIQTEELA